MLPWKQSGPGTSRPTCAVVFPVRLRPKQDFKWSVRTVQNRVSPDMHNTYTPSKGQMAPLQSVTVFRIEKSGEQAESARGTVTKALPTPQQAMPATLRAAI